MKFWRRKLPTGEALEREANRLGVSQYETWKGGAQGHTILDEPELQRRVLAARAQRRDAILNWVQTVGIVGSLLITLTFSVCNRKAQVNQTSGEFMLQFNDVLARGGSGRIMMDMGRPLANDPKVSDDDIDTFLTNYELLAAAYRHDLINRDMAFDAFSYELDKALSDPRVHQYVIDSRQEESDLYDGVLELAQAWGISVKSFTSNSTPTAQASSMASQ